MRAQEVTTVRQMVLQVAKRVLQGSTKICVKRRRACCVLLARGLVVARRNAANAQKEQLLLLKAWLCVYLAISMECRVRSGTSAGAMLGTIPSTERLAVNQISVLHVLREQTAVL